MRFKPTDLTDRIARKQRTTLTTAITFPEQLIAQHGEALRSPIPKIKYRNSTENRRNGEPLVRGKMNEWREKTRNGESIHRTMKTRRNEKSCLSKRYARA
jgi:hypothetical protein